MLCLRDVIASNKNKQVVCVVSEFLIIAPYKYSYLLTYLLTYVVVCRRLTTQYVALRACVYLE